MEIVQCGAGANAARRFQARLTLVACGFLALAGVHAQDEVWIGMARGERVAPIYEGWMENADGTFDMIFGYVNLNTEEIVDIPIGRDNNIEPGGPDQGQPEHFFTRRSLFVFRVKVPKDFGQRELVWTLTRHGKTEKAYGTLKPDYVIDERTMMINSGGFGGRGQRLGEPDNSAPSVRVDGATQRTIKVGEPLSLLAFASDDGYPRGGIGGSNDLGLGVGWFVYRGAARVTFEPEQSNPEFRRRGARLQARTAEEASRTTGKTPPMPRATASRLRPPPRVPVIDRRIPVKVIFGEAGTYVLRVMAHDGGLAATQDVTVTVLPAS